MKVPRTKRFFCWLFGHDWLPTATFTGKQAFECDRCHIYLIPFAGRMVEGRPAPDWWEEARH